MNSARKSVNPMVRAGLSPGLSTSISQISTTMPARISGSSGPAPTRRERSGFPTSSRWRRAMRRARSGIMMRSSPPKSVSPQGNQGGVPERW
jgi:hypothetical protein